MRPNLGSTVNFKIGCNTFITSGFSSGAPGVGIYAGPFSRLNSQGALVAPAGNKFDGYGSGVRSIVNENATFMPIYYRLNSSAEEQITSIQNTGPPSTITGSVLPSSSSILATNYCSNNFGVLTGAQARGTSQATLMQALMDTLRRQAAPVARLDEYQGRIRQWLLIEQPDTAALDAYVRTLPLSNPDAFFGLGLDLLEQYRRRKQTRQAALLHPVLAARVSTSPEASARLQLSDLLTRVARRDPWASRPATAADSAALRRLALTFSGTAETAAMWFNFLYPTTGVHAAPPPIRNGASQRPAASRATGLTGRVRALYPLPASTSLHLEATVSATTKQAVVQVANLLTGRVVLRTEMLGSGSERQAEIDVRGLPDGQYVAAVFSDGERGAVQKIVVAH